MSAITIDATVNAPRQKVWDYYTQPHHITHWNFASPDWHCPSASNDLTVGGKYTARMEAIDGSFGFNFEATYNEIAVPEKIIYTIADGRPVTVTFTEHEHHTHVIVSFEAEKINDPEMQRQGWQAILNNFKSYVEAN